MNPIASQHALWRTEPEYFTLIYVKAMAPLGIDSRYRPQT